MIVIYISYLVDVWILVSPVNVYPFPMNYRLGNSCLTIAPLQANVECFPVEVFVHQIYILFIHSYMNTHVKYHCIWICRVALNVFQGQFLGHVLV